MAELADFDPEDGHVHACRARATAFALAPNVAPCDCAALARDLAEDAQRDIGRLRWWLANRRDQSVVGEHSRRSLLDHYDRLNPAWIDHMIVGQWQTGTEAPPMMKPQPADAGVETPSGVHVASGTAAGSAAELMESMPPVRPRSIPT